MRFRPILWSLAVLAGLLLAAAVAFAVTAVSREDLSVRGTTAVWTYSETSAANTQLVVTVNPGKPFRLLWASVKYSGSVSVTFTTALDSHVGAAYDLTMDSSAISTATSAFIAPTGERIFRSTDIVLVTAPAGGSGVTAAVAVQVEIIQ